MFLIYFKWYLFLHSDNLSLSKWILTHEKTLWDKLSQTKQISLCKIKIVGIYFSLYDS